MLRDNLWVVIHAVNPLSTYISRLIAGHFSFFFLILRIELWLESDFLPWCLQPLQECAPLFHPVSLPAGKQPCGSWRNWPSLK